MFFKAFLNLNLIPMASILAFEFRSLKCLINENNEERFEKQYPLFYKQKIPKKSGIGFFYRNAIDIALRFN